VTVPGEVPRRGHAHQPAAENDEFHRASLRAPTRISANARAAAMAIEATNGMLPCPQCGPDAYQVAEAAHRRAP
jgi:hypothetical protein